MFREARISITNKDSIEEKGYLDLRLLGKFLTYAIIMMMLLGLVFLTGIVIWALRHILEI